MKCLLKKQGYDLRSRFSRSLSYYALIMLHSVPRILVLPSLHCRFSLFSRTALMSRGSFPDSLRAIILLSQSSIPFFPLGHRNSRRSPTETEEDIDIGRVSATRRRRHCAAEAMKKGEEKSGGQKEPREWRGKWRKKRDHRSARTIDKRSG